MTSRSTSYPSYVTSFDGSEESQIQGGSPPSAKGKAGNSTTNTVGFTTNTNTTATTTPVNSKKTAVPASVSRARQIGILCVG